MGRFEKQIVVSTHVLGPVIRGSSHLVGPPTGSSSMARHLCTHGYIPKGTYIPLSIQELVASRCRTIVPQHIPSITASDAESTPEELLSCVQFLRDECAEQLGRTMSKKATHGIPRTPGAVATAGDKLQEAAEEEDTKGADTSGRAGPLYKIRRLSGQYRPPASEEQQPICSRRGVSLCHIGENSSGKKKTANGGLGRRVTMC